MKVRWSMLSCLAVLKYEGEGEGESSLIFARISIDLDCLHVDLVFSSLGQDLGFQSQPNERMWI